MASALAVGAALGTVAYLWLTLPDATALKTQTPKTSALIETREREAREKGLKLGRRQTWVALEAIAPLAVEAVLVSEDSAFYQHHGIDTRELTKAVEEAARKGELGRGASTITQQLAKNLWLSGERSLLRKAKEFLLARRLEEALSKKRILTLYLNFAEWGNGVYGIEAGAHEHFGVSSGALSLAQGAILAAMLPAPRKWLPRDRPKVLKQRALRIVDHLEQYGRATPVEAAFARADIDRLIGVGSEVDSSPDESD